MQKIINLRDGDVINMFTCMFINVMCMTDGIGGWYMVGGCQGLLHHIYLSSTLPIKVP